VEKRKSLVGFEVITALVTKQYLLGYNAISPLKSPDVSFDPEERGDMFLRNVS
jgi:hypothetical protein